jgi:hypothetical protein
MQGAERRSIDSSMTLTPPRPLVEGSRVISLRYDYRPSAVQALRRAPWPNRIDDALVASYRLEWPPAVSGAVLLRATFKSAGPV